MTRKYQYKNPDQPTGRPTKMTPETIDKLRQAYLVGATNEEACAFAQIGVKTLYNYMEKHPEFVQEIKDWKSAPILKAKTTIVNKLNDVKNAQWYLERKAKIEYGSNVDITSDGKALPVPILGGISKESEQKDD